MGRRVQFGQDGQTYFDNTPFCVGYRDGTIQTLVPATECWDLAAPPVSEEPYGPSLPPPSPVYTSRVYARQPDNTMLYILLALAAVVVLRDSGKSKRRR